MPDMGEPINPDRGNTAMNLARNMVTTAQGINPIHFLVGAGPDGVGIATGDGAGEPNVNDGGTGGDQGGTSQPNPAGDAPKVGPNGFPLNTPVADMTDAQQTAYYKYHSRKHEERVKAYEGGLTAAEAKALQDRLDALETEKLSEQEKAVKQATAEAKNAGRVEAESELLPRLHKAEIRGIASSILDKDRLNTWLETTNLKAFVNDKGEVDEEKVMGTLTALYGDKQEKQDKQGSGSQGKYKDWGQNRGSSEGASKWDAGKAAAAKRFGKK